MERKKEQGISIQSSTPSLKLGTLLKQEGSTIDKRKEKKDKTGNVVAEKMWIRKKDRERKKKNRKEASKLKEILSTSTGNMINKIDKERRHSMNAAPTRPSN
jgi:hypothetical protein